MSSGGQPDFERLGVVELMPPESTITAAILKKLRAIPESYTLKIHGSEHGRAGVPDILFWCARVDSASQDDVCLSFAFEVKGPRGRVSPIQAVQARRMTLAGVRCSVVRSVDEVRAILGSYGIGMK